MVFCTIKFFNRRINKGKVVVKGKEFNGEVGYGLEIYFMWINFFGMGL